MFCHCDEVDPLGEVDDVERTIEAVVELSPAALEKRLVNQLGEGRTAAELALMTGYSECSDDGAERARIAMESSEVDAGVGDDLRASMLP